MKCERCGTAISENEKMEYQGQTLCEDCYMDALSPAKTCDPWAVYSAKSFSKKDAAKVELTDTQANLLRILEETGGVEPEVLAEKLQISLSGLEREIATLRHMEKVRGELVEGKKIIRLW